MNDLLAALLLGIIEGITEFLPISSTGHLLIAERWLGHRSDLFNISIQAGAILAVVLIYWQRLVSLSVGFREPKKRDYALKLALAFGVTAVLGVLVKKLGFELPESIEPVAWALLLGGFVILGVEAIDARRPDLPDDDPDAIGWGTAVLVGLAQVLAGVFPGTSRSAAAIFAALLFGKSSRLAATEFAFLVGIPTMFAATGYELVDMLQDGSAANEDWTALAVAFVASAITAFVAVKWLLRYIQTHRFTIFAWYRIAFGAALLGWLYFGTAAPLAQVRATSSSLELSAPKPHEAPTAAAMATSLRATGRPAPGAGSFANPDSVTREHELAVQQFRHAWLCGWAERERPMFTRELGVEQFVQPASAVSAEVRERQLKDARLFLSLLDRADAECKDAPLPVGSVYELALRAANAGDAKAAACYVAGAFELSPKRWERPEVRAAFRQNAERLINEGIARGDWNLARLAILAYYPKRAGPIFVEPMTVPDSALLTTAFVEGDAVKAYAIGRLLLLGASDKWQKEDRAQSSAHWGGFLTPAQRDAANAWAEATFVRAFKRQTMTPENSNPCRIE